MSSFSQCWLNANDGTAWVMLSSSIMMLYGFLLSNRKLMWKILLFHSVSGIVAQLIQVTYLANSNCKLGYSLDILLGFNEVSWFINEATIVLYSFFKAETVTYVILPKTVNIILRVLLGIYLFACVAIRIYVGYIHARDKVLWNNLIGANLGISYLASAAIDVVVIAMLIVAASKYVRAENSRSSAINIIFRSSVLRLIVMNVVQITLAVVVLIPNPSPSLVTFRSVIWLIRGLFTMILLFDIQSTHSLLVQKLYTSDNTV
ncbi:hypothetical protein HK096_004493 [Nowakowskiella sp. JEL0078]|nr:hypothetical protein HK096_004493 [Nowakowskiella sp. JEL0078]